MTTTSKKNNARKSNGAAKNSAASKRNGRTSPSRQEPVVEPTALRSVFIVDGVLSYFYPTENIKAPTKPQPARYPGIDF